MQNQLGESKQTNLIRVVYNGVTPKTRQDLQIFIGKSTVKAYEDMAERSIGEKLKIIASVNPKLHDLVTTAEFGKLQTVLNDLTTERLLMSIELILDRYDDLYLSDITLFVKMMASGRYEKPYGVPTPDYICRSFQTYYEARENARAHFREQRHAHNKQAHRPDIDMDKIYANMKAKSKANKLAKAEEKKNRKPVLGEKKFKAEDFKKKDLGI